MSTQIPIYKVKNVISNTIYVFYGETSKPNVELFKDVFSDEENKQIKSEKTTVVFCKEKIHFDDSIGTIKLKILNNLHRDDLLIDEMYLYCQRLETLNVNAVFQTLTQNSKLELNTGRFNHFYSNVVQTEDGLPLHNPAKDIVTFNDLYDMQFDNKKCVMNMALGQQFLIVDNEYPFVTNPFDVKSYDKLYERNLRKTVVSLNSYLLLNSGEIIDNTIYLCLAEDVLSYANTHSLSEEFTIKIYYPLLYNKNINNLINLQKEKPKFMENTRKLLSEKMQSTFETIDMFYDMYYLKKTELNYLQRGIKYIKAVIKPDFITKIPLEIIFKTVHATSEAPLIKYNPSTRQENVYRLFTDKISTNGSKIPYLKKATIFKLIKNIARNKSVGIYIEENLQTVICEIDEAGFITIYSEFQIAIGLDEIDIIFRKTVNPIIQEIKGLLEQSGYKLNIFNSLTDQNIEIKQLTYESQIKISKPFDITPYSGCISSIFINETDTLKDTTINLRFKRVSNYNKFTSQEAFILEKLSQGLTREDMINTLVENFDKELNREQAIEAIAKVANELQIERGVRKSDIKIKNNPGFKTNIFIERETGILTIRVENINNINYLYVLPIYLDSIVRLTQDKKTTNYPLQNITRICSGNEIEDIPFEESIDTSDQSLQSIEEDETTEGEEEEEPKDKKRTAMNLFFDNDESATNESDIEEVQSESEKEPVKKSEESEKSIESEKEVSEEPVKKSEESEKEVSEESEKSIESDNISFGSSINPEKSIESEESIESEKEPVKKSEESEKSIESDNISFGSSIHPGESVKSEESIESFGGASIKQTMHITDDSKSESDIESEIDSDMESDADSEPEVEEMRNIDGMKLNKPYYFQSLIENNDPALILKEDTPKYNSYTRTCSSNLRRQPVILTDAQLAKINKSHPNFLREEDVIKYGSNPQKQYNYICPRYWCLKNNTIIRPDELKEVKGKDGKIELQHPTCGKVIPHNQKIVTPGYYIYEFYKPKEGNPDSKKYPGLIPDSHPDNLCLPCCFDKYNTQGRIKANAKCSEGVSKTKEDKKVSEKKQKAQPKIEDEDKYIKGPEKFPLDSGRWGYLPGELQSMFQQVNADCQISKTNTNIKDNHQCLLRHGIEINDKQSFIACISDVLFYANPSTPILNISQMKARIIKAITIDTFITYQNGNLVTDFQNSDIITDVNKYNKTTLFSKLDMTKEEDKTYYSKVLSAFENFKNFLQDDESLIDHTYLWDIVSAPNKYLFPKGVNLVIMYLPDDDITNNVQFVCPKNQYASEYYRHEKNTIFLMKKYNYYEPIYSYTTHNNTITVAKDFKGNTGKNTGKTNPKLLVIKQIIDNIIKPLFNTICKPLDSMPNVYKMKRPLILRDLMQKLKHYEYNVKKMVLNFNNKVIGVLAEEPVTIENSGFIPCYPSALEENGTDFVFMNDFTLWKTYSETVHFLNKLNKISKNRRKVPDIPCKPKFKVIEDELVVGILTVTNQFIQLSQPISVHDIDANIDLQSLTNNNYIINPTTNPMKSTDVEIATSTDIDTERVEYIKKIRLETNFYNVFRNTVRILINDYENAKIRENIEKEMLNKYVIYSEKLKIIEEYLRELVKDKVQFIGDENYYKFINNVSTCIVKDSEKCSQMPNLCAVTANGKCNLILPKKNLMTNKENENIYYSKMSDELIRYNRIKSFMIKPKNYLLFGTVGYNLRENEIILIQSLLTQEYFDKLVPTVDNKYIKHNSYDEVNPLITQVYDNKFVSHEHINEANCAKKINSHITSTIWKTCFPANYSEIEYDNVNICTYNIIIDLIQQKTGNTININQLKNELYEEYKKYLEKYHDKIVDILIIEGKKTIGDQVNSGIVSFANFIYSDNYFLTTMDLWLLVTKYEIPTIFICQKWILQTNYEEQSFIAYGNEGDEFAFIVIPGLRPKHVPNYKIIQTTENNIFISLDELNECDYIKNIFQKRVVIEDYLETFVKPAKTIYSKKKPKQIIVEEDEEVRIPKKPRKKIIIEPESEPEPDKESEEEEVIIKNPKKSKTKKTRVKIKGTKQATRKRVIE